MATRLTPASDGDLNVNRVRRNLEQVRAELADAAPGHTVRVLAAVKYVSAGDVGLLAAAGIDLAGENRAQELARKATAHPSSNGTSSANSRAARCARSCHTRR